MRTLAEKVRNSSFGAPTERMLVAARSPAASEPGGVSTQVTEHWPSLHQVIETDVRNGDLQAGVILGCRVFKPVAIRHKTLHMHGDGSLSVLQCTTQAAQGMGEPKPQRRTMQHVFGVQVLHCARDLYGREDDD